MHALVATGAWRAISTHRFNEAIPWLCDRFVKVLGRPELTLTDQLWRPVLSGKDPESFADRLTQAGLSPNDLIALSEEVHCVMELCGAVVDGTTEDDHDEREAVSVLCQLVSPIFFVIRNKLRG